jgi:hypothetical protein
MMSPFVMRSLQNTGTSLMETFTAVQIRAHVSQVQEAAQPFKHLLPPTVQRQDICIVCGLSKILFEPPLMYCMNCNLKIKRGQTMHRVPERPGEASDQSTVAVRMGIMAGSELRNGRRTEESSPSKFLELPPLPADDHVPHLLY